MEMKLNKRALINKSNSTIVGIAGGAAFIIVFCLVASKSLISQELYQARVIKSKNAAISQVKQDIIASGQLTNNYQTFIAQNPNLIGGNANGDTGQDGNNAKITLDALPSTYDFPALTTSIASMVSGEGLTVNGITSADLSATVLSTPTGSPSPIPIPFSVNVEGTYSQIQSLITVFENSIRPIKILKIDISGNQTSISASISAQTYFQPGKILNFTQETVK